MPVSIEELRPHLQAFDFPRLFVEGLGWDHYVTEPFVVRVNERDYTVNPIAEKTGFAVYECDSSGDNNIPQYPVRRKIESEVAKRTFEHLIIFTDPGRKAQVWQWVRRESGKPAACREYAYTGGSGDHLLQRIQPLFVSLDEEPSLNIALVASRVRAALDVERVTKRFYERFQKELEDFGKFIEGITAQGDRDWYASLMLNRMMFVYFVQKQGFLDEDIDYLRNRLKMVQEQGGGGRFQQFYRLFLLRLFHEGLGQPEAQRAPDLAALLGRVPFLNGGLFDVHDLERDNPGISIPDAAFERVFDFFDSYRWHLDERPHREDNEINPDVLGYIFEKYVNQKQMGAYYTKEDITGYISRNTVVPFLFDAAKKECPVAFGPDGGVWRLLQDDPDRYIYPAVGHGIAWSARQPAAPCPLDKPFDLPEDIAAGIEDVSKRGGWNAPAPDDYALPTETWREVAARRTRYEEVRAKLASGEVQKINDLITLNLDIERFARDVIAQSEGPELLRAFWHAMRDVSVLDPTCGSGAFLFAALNILEPLYTACLEGMRGFLDDAERSERKRSPGHLSHFRRILEQVDKHPSERYFILKSIVLNNLYGVDIMGEAVEICKLRLFLKLVAQLESYDQIEPLPDIDFNIRTGNTLVGFTSLEAVRQAMTVMPNGQHRQVFPEDQEALDRINEEAEIASAAFNQFRWQQTMFGGEVTSADKQALRDRLRSLDDELDHYLAREHGVDLNKAVAYDTWSASHQPFHWFVEFYGIMSKGGFDVVIGNPPYVESRSVSEYKVRGYRTESCGDLYAYTLERVRELSHVDSWIGYIVPLSCFSVERFAPIQQLYLNEMSHLFISHWSGDAHPSKLFEGVDKRLQIVLARNHGSKGLVKLYSSRYLKWYADERAPLFDLSPTYQQIASLAEVAFFASSVPKLCSDLEMGIIEKLRRCTRRVGSLVTHTGEHQLYYTRKVSFFLQFLDFVPEVRDDSGESRAPSELKILNFNDDELRTLSLACLSTSLFYWYNTINSDCRNLNKREIVSFPVPSDVPLATQQVLHELLATLMRSYNDNSILRTVRYKRKGNVTVQYFNFRPSKPIIDKIDRILAEHYGFTEEELDFIINYDIKYRMGREEVRELPKGEVQWT